MEEGEPGKDRVVVLSHRLWKRRFGLQPEMIGKSVRLNGEEFTVVGVLGAKSNFDRNWAELWTPLAFDPKQVTREFHFLQVYARLKSGITRQQAQAAMDTIGANLREEISAPTKAGV
jgi:hypothetical protein